MKHTPTPWSRNIRSNGKYPVIFAGRNQHVCVVSQQQSGEETEANIDFIVRACNAHDSFITFVQKARDFARESGDEALYAEADELLDQVGAAQ